MATIESGAGRGNQASAERHVGVVAILEQELGAGYIRELSSGQLFGVSRKFLGSETWSRLKRETRVSFTDNGRGCVNSDLMVID